MPLSAAIRAIVAALSPAPEWKTGRPVHTELNEAALAAAPAAGGVLPALLDEAVSVLEAVRDSGHPLPNNWRWPLLDELSGSACILRAAAAQGEGNG